MSAVEELSLTPEVVKAQTARLLVVQKQRALTNDEWILAAKMRCQVLMVTETRSALVTLIGWGARHRGQVGKQSCVVLFPSGRMARLPQSHVTEVVS